MNILEVISKGPEENKTHDTRLKFNDKNFAKKAIIQMLGTESENLLFTLTEDGTLSVHQCPNLSAGSLNLVKKDTPNLTKLNVKNQCTLFSVDKTESGQIRIAVVLKRKIVLADWLGNDFVQRKEIPVSEVKLCLWCGQSICIGFKNTYQMVDVYSGVISELFQSGNIPKPFGITVIDKQVLLGKENITVFIGYDGKPTRKFGISWSEPPIAGVQAFPYVVSILQKGVEIQFMYSSLSQTIPNIVANFISVTSDGDVYLVNKAKASIHKLSPVPFSEQIESLIQKKKYPEALALCENLQESQIPERDEKIKNLKKLTAYTNFNSGQFPQAMETFIELQSDALEIIALFTGLLPDKLKFRYTFPVPIEEPKAANMLSKAKEALASFLEAKRKERKISEPTALKKNEDIQEWKDTQNPDQIVDTVLLKCYVATTNNSALNVLLSSTNFCHVKECEGILKKQQKNKELIALYRSRGLHEYALDELQRYGSDRDKELAGVRPSVEYMKNLGAEHLDLIIKHSGWVVKQQPIQGLEIFLHDRNPPLPPVKVLQHLEATSIQSELVRKSQIVVLYLEHVVQFIDPKSNEFNNKLLLSYFESVIDLKKDVKSDQYQDMRKKLVKFLRNSNYYVPQQIIPKYDFDKFGLHEERAILLSKMRNHKDALKEYVHKLQNFDEAEKYCVQHYNKDNEQESDVYLSLLEVYLTPPDKNGPKESDLREAAVKLLNTHYQEIEVTKALDIIPEHTPLSLLYPYLEKVFRETTKSRRNLQVISNLQKAETVKVKTEFFNLRSRYVKITEDTMCVVCNKRLNDAAFALYPTQGTDVPVTVHYQCYLKIPKNICPLTGEVFGDPK
uniref:CNH domain-containing protein n=1 Tax=Arcella intermedia TaxID=1963864 RepID=A0A6B2KXZ8_9EUKA